MKIQLRIKNQYISLEKILCTIYLIFFFVKYFVHGYAMFANIVIISIGILSYITALVSQKCFNLIRIVFILDMASLICMFLNANYSIDTWLMSVSLQGISLLLLLDEKAKTIIVYYFYFIICYTLIYAVLGRTPEMMLDKASENFISIILIGLFCIYCITVEDKFKIFVSWVICTMLCVWAGGRNGIICFLVFAAIYFAFGNEYVSWVRKMISILLLIAICCLLFTEFQGIIQQAYMSEGRLALWQRYCHTTLTSPKNLIIGTDFLNDIVFMSWGKNLHNSFLMIHAEYGVIPIIALVVGIVEVVINKQRKIWIYCLIAILVRAMTDSFLIGDICDLPFYYMIFKSVSKNRKRK